MTNNETVCSAFWHHTNIRGGDRIFPCCRYKQPVDVFTGNVSSILHTPVYNNLRTNSLNGIRNENCSKCYLEESLGRTSLRQQFNQQYDCKSVELKYLEIGFDNICNLTCDGCWGEWSSAWAIKENPETSKKVLITRTPKITDIPNSLEKIVFLGGEPLMTSRHSKFLSALDNLNEISVIYYTNGMFLINDADLLKKAKSVEFNLSIDGVGELNDKVRSGSNWPQILEFIEQVQSLGFILSIHTVLHKNNWQGLLDLEEFVATLGVKWTVNPLTYPSKLDVRSCENKNQIFDLVSKSSIPNKNYILSFLS